MEDGVPRSDEFEAKFLLVLFKNDKNNVFLNFSGEFHSD